MHYPSLLAVAALCASACDKPSDAKATSSTAAPRDSAVASAAPTNGSTSTVTPGGTLTGTVREQIPVEPYVYVRLETPNGEIWAAVNEAPIVTGSSITVYNVLPMEQFASKTLNRTFERIYFGALEPSRGMTNGAPATAGGVGTSSTADGTPPAPDAKVGRIARASGADARSIGDVWTQKSHLAGVTVTLRGVVVKYNPGVMGKNWIHLQDGTGDAARGTHDIAVTTNDAAALGDTVTITGTVRTNRDVGAGYTFAVIVEEARVNKK